MVEIRCASGYACSGLEYASQDELAYICGNALLLQSLSSSSQRLIRGTSFGLQGFAVNRRHGLVAVAEKGPNPAILIYSVHDLQLLGSLRLDFKLGCTCIAFSADGERLAVGGEEPDARISVYAWRKAEHLVMADLPRGCGMATHISFHPYDGDRLATTLVTVAGQGTTWVWRIQRLWDRCELRSKQVLLDAARPCSTHCWYPGGLYVGTSTGHLYAALFQRPPQQAHPPTLSNAASMHAGNASAAASMHPGRSTAVSAHSEGGVAVPPTQGAGEAAAEAASAPAGPAGWDAVLMADVWGTGEEAPITALSVSRDVVAVGGPEALHWLLHPRELEHDDEDQEEEEEEEAELEAGAPGAHGAGVSGARKAGWHMRKCGFYEVGLGSGVVALAYGRHEAPGVGGQVALGTADGRILVLELGTIVAAVAAVEAQQREANAVRARALRSDPSIGGLLLLQQRQQREQQEHRESSEESGAYAGMLPQHVRVMVDAHVGAVGGLAAHPDGEGMITCGADGTVRLWGLRGLGTGGSSSGIGGSGGAPSMTLLARRAFSSAQTCLATAPVTVNKEMALAGVGSETGVLRLLALPSAQKAMTAPSESGEDASRKTPTRPIQVLWRRRLHRGPLHCVAFSPDGSMLATAGKDNALWFLSLNRDGTALPLGQIMCPGEILCIVWPEVHGVDEGVLVSLAAGAIACVRAPIELHAASRPTTNEGLLLGPPHVSTQLVRVEAPLLSMLPLGGPQYGQVFGLGADQMVHRILLPQDSHDWSGLRSRPLRSMKRVCVHQRRQSAICAPPSTQLIATGSTDGTLVLLDVGLSVVDGPDPPTGSTAGPASAGLGSKPPSRGSVLTAGSSGNRAGILGGELGTGDEELDEEEEEEQLKLPGYKGPLVVGMHDVLSQGIAAMAFDSRGRCLVSCGHDGSMFVCELHSKDHVIHQEACSVGSLVVLGSHDADAYDEEDEAWEADSAASRPATTPARKAPPKPAHGGPSIEKRLQALRNALAECTARNDNAPELEKVDHADFIIDHGLVKELKAKADATVKESRVAAQKEGLVMEITAARIRAMCWDAMDVRGQYITPITSSANSEGSNVGPGHPCNLPEAVHNFPLLEDSKRQRQLAQVSFLRQVEIVERSTTDPSAYTDASPRLGVESSTRSLTSDAPSPKTPAPSAAKPSTAGSGRAGASPEPRQSQDGSRSMRHSTTGLALAIDRRLAQGLDGLLYSSFDLHSPTRKIAQAHFLIQKVRDLKAEFNMEWERLWQQKMSDMDKITDLNARLEDTMRDLEKLEAPVQQTLEQLRIPLSFPEDMVNVLTVRDEEVRDCIRVDKQLGKAGLPQADGANPGDSVEGVGALDRGLRQMMGGTLGTKQHKEQVYTLVKPDWMDGNPTYFTPLQQKEVQEFKLKEKQMAEERAKRVNTLEIELRTLRSALEATAQQFDNNLKALSQKRNIVAANIGAYEVAVLGLAAALEAASEAGEHKEQQAQKEMVAANEARTRIAIELSGRRRALAEVEAPLPELYAQEKALDRNFKKEFADAEHNLGRLLQLYRLRTTVNMYPHHPHGSPLSTRPSMAHSQHHSQGAAAAVHVGTDPMRRTRTRRHSQALSVRESMPAPQHEVAAEARPSSPLSELLHHPMLEEVQKGSPEPWPDLPQPLVATIISSSLPPGVLPPGAPQEPETLGEEHKPEGLSNELWHQFEAHRGARVRGEAEVARLEACCVCLQNEIKQLEAMAEASTAASAEAMQKVQNLQNARRTALLDVEMQLRLKAGQLEVGLGSVRATEPGGLLAGMQDAVFVHRGVVEAVNEQIRQRAVRNVDVLHAIKEFKKGIHLLEWDHKRCDMLMEDTAERVRELQLLHVTRDMHAVFREGESAVSGTAAAVAVETSNLEALARQIERLHKKAIQERVRELKRINTELLERGNRNGEIGRHLIGLSQVVEEQRRLRASMGSMDDGVRRMRSLVTHKKLKEIALAQADEVRVLAAELDHLRQHTYPTFVEPVPASPADFRPMESNKSPLKGRPSGVLRGKHLTKSLGRLF